MIKSSAVSKSWRPRPFACCLGLMLGFALGANPAAVAEQAELPTPPIAPVPAAPAPGEVEAQDDPPIGSIFDLAIAGESDEFEDLTERCIHLHKLRKMEALTEHHVVLTMKDASKYLVQFKGCPGLRENVTLRYSSNGSRLCAHDGLQPITGLGAARTFGPSCQIPGFEPVSDEQIEFVLAEYTSWKAARQRR